MSKQINENLINSSGVGSWIWWVIKFDLKLTWNRLLTTDDVVGISLFSYPKVNKAQEIKTKQKDVVLSIAKMSLPYHNKIYLLTE